MTKEKIRSAFEARMAKSDLTINRFGNYRASYVQNKWNDFYAGYQAALAVQAQQKPVEAFAEVFEASNALIEDINAEYAAHLATEQYREVGIVTVAGLNRFPKLVTVHWTGAVSKGDKLYVKTP